MEGNIWGNELCGLIATRENPTYLLYIHVRDLVFQEMLEFCTDLRKFSPSKYFPLYGIEWSMHGLNSKHHFTASE